MSAGKLCHLTIHLQPFGKLMRLSKLAIILFATLTVVAFSAPVSGQHVEQAGLKQAWFTHSGIGASGKLADWYLDIDENSGTTFFEISGGTYSETLSERDIGPNGTPLGIEFGLRFANIKAEVVAARLKSETGKDVEVKVNQYTLPKSTLYTQTDKGIVRSYDAETGKVRWTTNLGNEATESLGVVGKGGYVAALKGGKVFCLESETGAVLWSKRCKHGPSAPPQVDEYQIYVPLVNGRVERFNIQDKGFNSITYISGGSGSTTTRPAISPLSICWVDYSGTVSVASRFSDRGMPGFELKAGSVLGQPQFKNGIYFISSIDSYVYALSEKRGSLIWENSTGFEITQPPILLGNHVYVINNLNQLSRFDAATGQLSANWQTTRPDIGTYAGASSTKIFTVSKDGRLKILDQESGDVTGTAELGDVSIVLPNTKTDRMYVLNKSGTIRCFREIGSVRPFFHSDEFEDMKPEEKMTDKPKTTEEEGGNPFGGGGDDPFSGGSDDNPFGGGDDAPADGGGSNPFGGGDDKPADSDDKPADDDDKPAAGGDDPFGDPFGGGDDAPSSDTDDEPSDEGEKAESPSDDDDDDPFGDPFDE